MEETRQTFHRAVIYQAYIKVILVYSNSDQEFRCPELAHIDLTNYKSLFHRPS